MNTRASRFLFVALLFVTCAVHAKTERVYIASGGQGIVSAQLDLSTGLLTTNATLAAEHAPASFLAVSPDHLTLYAVGKSGKTPNMVSAFAIEPHTGKLTLMNELPAGGGDPCHVSVDDSGKHLFLANYGGGSVSSFSLSKNGSLDKMASAIQHQGSSVNKERQAGPHGHCIIPDEGGHHALACDLGLDKVLVYQVNATTGELIANNLPFGASKPGAGPRHIALNPSGRSAYVVNELDSTITVFSYEQKSGALDLIQNLSTVPADFTGKNYPAEVAVSASGKFVYGSNRGHDSIAVFEADKRTGQLTLVEYCPTQGKNPRHFEIDPTGKFLLAANVDTGNLVVFKIDTKTGRLTPAGQSVAIKSPMCVKILPVE